MNVAQLSALVQSASGGAAQAAPALSRAPAPAPQPAATAAPAPTPVQASREALDRAVQQIRQFLDNTPADIQFSVLEGSDRVLLQVVDPSTKQVLLQVPSEVVLQVAKALDRYEGLFVSDKA